MSSVGARPMRTVGLRENIASTPPRPLALLPMATIPLNTFAPMVGSVQEARKYHTVPVTSTSGGLHCNSL